MSLDGLLLVDKPTGVTSHDVVSRLRKALKMKRIGHTGTLDPLATGVMILVLGEATKLSDYLMSESKAYRVDVRLGVTTDSLDRTGKVLSENPVNLSADEIRTAAEDLEGEFEWPVPLYSAKKVGGRPLHEMARNQEAIEAPLKIMKFWNIRVLRQGPSTLQVELECSKGSFIRTWVSELGRILGCGAVVDELRRLRVGEWSLDQCVTLEDLEKSSDDFENSKVKQGFIGLSSALTGYRSVFADERESRLMSNGQIAKGIQTRLIPEQKEAFLTGQSVFVKVLSSPGSLLAIIAAEPGQGLKIRRVFQSN